MHSKCKFHILILSKFTFNRITKRSFVYVRPHISYEARNSFSLLSVKNECFSCWLHVCLICKQLCISWEIVHPSRFDLSLQIFIVDINHWVSQTNSKFHILIMSELICSRIKWSFVYERPLILNWIIELEGQLQSSVVIKF